MAEEMHKDKLYMLFEIPQRLLQENTKLNFFQAALRAI